MFTVTRIGVLPIFHAHTNDRALLAFGFMRMQEYYESPKFRGKTFTHKEFIDWYTKYRGSFSYVRDWEGFNVPSDSVKTVLQEFPDHSAEELELFEALRSAQVFTHERFYLIGSFRCIEGVFQHEMCHALYFTLPHYRATADAVTHRYGLEAFRTYLLNEGYCNEVMDDELQAYAMSYSPFGAPRTLEYRSYCREIRTALRPFLSYLTAP